MAEDLTKNLFGDSTVSGFEKPNPSVEIFDKVSAEIFSRKSIETKTDISRKQVMAFARAEAFGKKYKRPLLRSLVKSYCIYAVSENRQSRKEFSNVAKANLGMSLDDGVRSIPDRLMGRVR